MILFHAFPLTLKHVKITTVVHSQSDMVYHSIAKYGNYWWILVRFMGKFWSHTGVEAQCLTLKCSIAIAQHTAPPAQQMQWSKTSNLSLHLSSIYDITSLPQPTGFSFIESLVSLQYKQYLNYYNSTDRIRFLKFKLPLICSKLLTSIW